MGWDRLGIWARWIGFRGRSGVGREYRETGDGMVTPLSLRVFRIRFQVCAVYLFCGDGLCNVKVDLGSYHDSSQSG
jgi:hypothetical protein